MGFLDSLFSDKKKTETSQNSQLTPWGPLGGSVEDIARRAAELGLQPSQYFGDQTFVGLNPTQRMALEQQQGLVDNYQDNLVNPTLDVWKSKLGGVDAKPYQDALDRFSQNTMENYNRHVLPGINDRFTGGGGRRSSRGGVAEGIALENVQDSIADKAANLNLDHLNLSNQNQWSAINSIGNAMNWGLQPGDYTQTIQDNLLSDDRNQLSEDIARHNFNTQGGQFNNLNQGANLVYSPAEAFGTKEGSLTSTTRSRKSPFDIAVGALTAGFGGGGVSSALGGGAGGGAGGLQGLLGGGGGGGLGNTASAFSNLNSAFNTFMKRPVATQNQYSGPIGPVQPGSPGYYTQTPMYGGSYTGGGGWR